VQLDGGALRVEAEAGLALFVGADAVVGDKGAGDGTALLLWTIIPTLPRLPSPVRPLQTTVCNVEGCVGGEPECAKENGYAPVGRSVLPLFATRLAPVRMEAP